MNPTEAIVREMIALQVQADLPKMALHLRQWAETIWPPHTR